MKERTEALNKFFAISISILELNVDRMNFTGIKKAIVMLKLHLIGLEEINKPNPDLNNIDALLFQIGVIYSQPLPQFESGAVPKQS